MKKVKNKSNEKVKDICSIYVEDKQTYQKGLRSTKWRTASNRADWP